MKKENFPLSGSNSKKEEKDDEKKKEGKYYRVNSRGEVEFVENPYKVPEIDKKAEK